MSLLFKMIYTALLLGITSVAAREIWQVWFDTRVYVGSFEVITETGKDEEASTAFAKRIVAEQTILAQQLTDYRTRRDAVSDTTYRLDGIPLLQLPPEVLRGMEITIQEINLRQILTAVRRNFLAPNEVRGSVTQRDGSVIAVVDWPRAPSVSRGSSGLTRFLARTKDAQAVAALVACSIFWARVGGDEPDVLVRFRSWFGHITGRSTSQGADAPAENALATLSREQFCNFGAGLGDLYALEEAASSADGLDDAQINQVRKRAAALRSHYAELEVLPDIHRLRADLLDLLPEGKRLHSELVDAQEDRLRYAMLSPALSALPEEKKRLAALALARPAFVLHNGKPQDVKANWAGLLSRHAAEIDLIAAATGKIVGGGMVPYAATGFIVAPRLMMTASYIVDGALSRPAGPESPGSEPLRLCLESNAHPCTDGLAIGKVVYNGKAEGSNVALLELPFHDPALDPPVPISDIAIQANAIIGQYAYCVGYPSKEFRMPPEFMDYLLGDADGSQRLMPGRILAFGTGSWRGDADRKVLTSDISTSAGANFADRERRFHSIVSADFRRS